MDCKARFKDLKMILRRLEESPLVSTRLKKRGFLASSRPSPQSSMEVATFYLGAVFLLRLQDSYTALRG